MAATSPIAPESAAHRQVRVLENVPVARDTYRLRIEDPETAAAITPGQFVMIRPLIGGGIVLDPLLGRPYALFEVVRDAAGEPLGYDVVYLLHGRGTRLLGRCQPGDTISAWGPLGNGFGVPPEGPVALVAGGIGQTPMLALARWWTGQATYGTGSQASFPVGRVPSVTLYYGARTAELLAGIDAFEAAGVTVRIATDDGSAGHHGRVTDLLAADLEAGATFAELIGCGPSPMLRALSGLAEARSIPCRLSVENTMACGYGACYTCVVPIRQPDGSIDLRRVCTDGPVFDAASVCWDYTPA